MKLAAIYNVFDGEELLEGSIKQIYSEVDNVIIIYQTTSNYGNFYDNTPTLKKIQDKYPCILEMYNPDLTLGRQGANNEIKKREMGLNIARHIGCTHALFMDCDEYYKTNEFAHAKKLIEKNAYDATACKILAYYKEPIYQITPPEKYFVPFIFQIKRYQSVGGGFKVYCDPTRGVTPVTNFAELPLIMHHFSNVRRDIGLKFNNSSARPNFTNIPKMIEKFNNWKIGQSPKVKKVSNIFEISVF